MRSGRGGLLRPGPPAGFVAQSLIHPPKPLTEIVSIRAAEPRLVVSERAGQQLHGNSSCPDGRNAPCGPPEPVVLNPLHKPFDFSLRPEASIKAKPFGSDKTNRNCGARGVKMWADCGLTGVLHSDSGPNRSGWPRSQINGNLR